MMRFNPTARRFYLAPALGLMLVTAIAACSSGSSSSTSTTPSTPAIPGSHGDVVAVPTTLSVTGDYARMTAFISGLDNFPRLFVIQQFDLVYGTVAPSTGGASSAGSASSASAAAAAITPNAKPLWVGGTPTSPTAGPYTLAITGSIYYTSTPNALAACTKATATVH